MLATNAGLLTPILGDPSPWTPQRLYLNNEAGLYYEPADLTAEKVAWRRNLLTWSEDFTNSVWTKSAATITANTATAPDGTTTADTLTDNATNDFHGIYQAITYAGPFTASLYVKYVNKQYVSFLTNNNNTGDRAAYFDIVNKTVHSVNAQFTASIVDVGGGWLRLTVSGQSFATAARYYFWSIALNTTTTPYLGDGTGQVQVWGGMVNPSGTVESYQRITDFTSDFLAAFPTHTLYQDSAGTTPVTALGQPVGLVLDRSRGALANLGSELRSTGAVGLVGTATAATYNTTTGAGTMVRVDASNQSYIEFTGLSNAAVYRVEIANTGAVSLTLRTGNYVGTPVISIAAGSTGIALAQPTSGALTLVTGTGTGAFTVVSVRLVPGVHAIQPTSASRPALDARVNLLTYSEQFDNAAWNKNTGGSIAANTVVAPDGTTTADAYTWATSTATYGYLNQSISSNATAPHLFAIYIKRPAGSGNRTIRLQLSDVTLSSGSSGTFVVTEDWQLFSYTRTSANNTGFVGVALLPGATGTPIAAGEVLHVWGADLRLATDAAYPYQRVVTATDYADVGVPRSFLFDGFDDSLYTASTLDLSGTDKVTVWAGVYKNSDAASGVVVEHSTGVPNNRFALRAPQTAAANYGYTSGGTAVVTATTSNVYAAPNSSVLSGVSSIADDICLLRLNGAQVATDATDQGTGNYGNNVLFIGRRNNASLPLNGKLYIPVVRGAQTDAATLALTDRYVGSRMGIVL